MTPEEINKLNNKNKNTKIAKVIMFCENCNRTREVNYNSTICPVCNLQLQNCNIKTNRFETQPQTKSHPNTPKCPTCNSTNIKKISSLSRAAHGYAFGLFSKTARSQFECKNCGYKW